jgi:spoIIIJ-associated protein
MGLREFEGRDLDDAIRQAARELGVPDADLNYEILEQGRKGILGLGAKSVRIRVVPPIDGPSEPPRHEPTPRPTPAAPAVVETETHSAEQDIARVLGRITELSGLDLAVHSAGPSDGEVALSMTGADRKLLMHKNGELLHALQFLLNRMARRSWPGVSRIRLRAEGGGGDRDERDGKLVELARQIARQVSESGQPRRTRPMNAYERRLVHLAVREIPGLASRSEGGGALKRVRILKARGA